MRNRRVLDKARSARKVQLGMSLVEVLVALVIFALGLLGAGGLLLSSLRTGQFSSSASTAMGLARDYGELMQLVPASVVSTTTAGTSVFTIDTTNTLATPTDCKGTSATCTPQQAISFGVFEWADRVRNALPNGRAVVCKDSEPKTSDGLYKWACDEVGDLTVVKFGWASKAASAGGDTAFTQDLPKLTIVLFGNQNEFVTP
jgi:type IV pilus assembly protein PilV